MAASATRPAPEARPAVPPRPARHRTDVESDRAAAGRPSSTWLPLTEQGLLAALASMSASPLK